MAGAEELKELFYEPFDSGKEVGVAGKAGTKFSVEARGKIDLDRGTFAFFTKSKEAPVIGEWQRLAGVNAQRENGYWGMVMGFDMRQSEFLFNFYDVGNYSPPLRLPPNLGRWKAGEWHHLAVVWDRHEGVTAYEDGKRVASNWGQHHWEWNLMPNTLFVNGIVDEVHTYASCLTDAQIAQLAKNEKPTGEPIAPSPAEKHREADLARMGWSGESLARMPVVETGAPQMFTFARITECVDAKRPVAQLFEGFYDTSWPLVKYGASTKGEELAISLAPKPSYDRVRLFVHRPFDGALVRSIARVETQALAIHAPQSGVWHGKLDGALSDEALTLKRRAGNLGQLDFYRVEPMAILAREAVALHFAKADSFPDSEMGRALQGETPVHFQQPITAVKAASPAWSLQSPAFGGFQAFTEAPDDAKAFDGALVTLVAEINEPTPVRVEIKEPVLSSRTWLVADAVLKPKGGGRQTFTLLLKGRPVINMPPYRVPQKKVAALEIPGVPFGIVVAAASAVQWQMGDGGCSVAFTTTDLQKALPVAAEDQVEFLRESYAEEMEGHLYKDKHIQMPLTWLAKFAPTHPKFQQMYERVDSPQLFEGIAVPKIEWHAPSNTTGAPEWAFWQMEAMKEHRRMLHWIIEHKQVRTGEYGGVWNDDTDHIENWIELALSCDGDGRIKDSLRKFWDGLWTHQLIEGVGKYAQDSCHYYEEGMGSTAMRALVDYGDPVVMERVMAASSHYDKWLRPYADGALKFQSDYVSINGPGTFAAFAQPEGYLRGHCYDLFVPSAYLLWYDRHPAIAKIFVNIKPDQGWAASAYDHLTDIAAARQRYAQLAVQPRDKKAKGDSRTVTGWIDEVGLTDDIRKALAQPYKPLAPIRAYLSYYDTDEHWMLYRTSGDVRYVVDSYKRVCEWFARFDWLMAAAQPSMDRNPLPRTTLVGARMGALAANRGASSLVWPRYGISYTRGEGEIAALVTENLDNHLTARFYAFADKPHEVEARVWRMEPGTYRVSLFDDKNDDGQPEGKLMEKEMTLDRGAFVGFTLPPRQSAILRIEPIRTQPVNYDQPDAAISLMDTELVYGEHLVVRVHNIGRKPIENLLVRVRDGRSGQVVVTGEQTIDRIEAPLDLKPKIKTVEFKNINANTYGSIIIEVDPENRVEDLNRHNNRIVLTY